MQKAHQQTETLQAPIIKDDFTDEEYNNRLIRVFVNGLRENRFNEDQIPEMLYSLYRGSSVPKEKIASKFIKAGGVAGICSSVLKSIPFAGI